MSVFGKKYPLRPGQSSVETLEVVGRSMANWPEEDLVKYDELISRAYVAREENNPQAYVQVWREQEKLFHKYGLCKGNG